LLHASLQQSPFEAQSESHQQPLGALPPQFPLQELVPPPPLQ
jgi:hypothetical protein